jgi:hypothetical protein
MIDHLAFIDDTILVHLKEDSLKATKSFTHRGIQLAANAQTISFVKLLPGVWQRFIRNDLMLTLDGVGE